MAVAALKQSLRVHAMHVGAPLTVQSLLAEVQQPGTVAFLAAAGGDAALQAFARARAHAGEAWLATADSTRPPGGERERVLLIVGPEGDLTEGELAAVLEVGGTAVGLGPRRLRVETAAVALLSAFMLSSEL